MHCNCCTIALFSHLGYYFIKHTLHFITDHQPCATTALVLLPLHLPVITATIHLHPVLECLLSKRVCSWDSLKAMIQSIVNSVCVCVCVCVRACVYVDFFFNFWSLKWRFTFTFIFFSSRNLCSFPLEAFKGADVSSSWPFLFATAEAHAADPCIITHTHTHTHTWQTYQFKLTERVTVIALKLQIPFGQVLW